MILDNYTFNTGETQIELREKYNPDGSDLRKAQLRMLDMLKYLDKVCCELSIPYSLDGGNILGAVRHNGFIPWDDDVDVIIERKYFKQLNEYLENNLHPQYVIQNYHTDKGYMGCWAVLRDKKSEYIQNCAIHNLRKYRGLQIDIFPMEIGVNKLIHFGCYGLHKFFVDMNLQRGNIKTAKFFFNICNEFVFPIVRLCCKIFGNRNKLMYPLGTRWDWRYKRKDIFPLARIMFEGISISCVNNPDEFLKEHFGNYMELPPKEKRNHHHASYKIWD